MKFLLALFLVYLTLLLPINTKAKQNNLPIEEVIAVGVRPGPELWKISKDGNVLWILGTLSPLAKKMTWHTGIVERVIADSQTLITYPSVTTGKIGFFQGLSLATSAIGIKRNPNKKTLKDVIPSTLYKRWIVLKKKYIGNDRGIEKSRPLFASSELFEKAIKKTGLKSNTKIEKKILKMAKKNKLKIITPLVTIELNKPKATLKKFKKSKISDLECFSQTLDKLEFNLTTMRQRAYAWAYGDITKLKNLPIIDNRKSCTNAILSSQIAQDAGMSNLEPRLRSIWLDEAKKALAQNKSTFAVLSINNLLSGNSYLNDLKLEGYKIEVPK